VRQQVGDQPDVQTRGPQAGGQERSHVSDELDGLHDGGRYGAGIDGLGETVDGLAEQWSFSGAVRVDVDGATVLSRAYGLADRAHAIRVTGETRFGIASGTKGLTALTIGTLLDDGTLEPSSSARSVLGADLPLIDDAVTIEHLLAHRSGIGDYLDESAVGDVTDYVMPVPVHQLATTQDYLPVLDGHPQVSPPGEVFAYNNGGYVMLALIAERVTGTPFADLVHQRVCTPAGMASTAFLRSDELPGDTAIGYLHAHGLRTNVLHLPVRGSGDGGIYSTLDDVHALWSAAFAGRVVRPERLTVMLRPRSSRSPGTARYGLGFWVDPARDDVVWLKGADAGVSFRTVHDQARRTTYSVVSNSSLGAWPLARLLQERLTPA
jgi:CubicO group peptidase (beta-lactamase class C family)